MIAFNEKKLQIAVRSVILGGASLGVGSGLAFPVLAATAIEEVVVTASRRSTPLSEIPSNLTAYSGEALEQRNIETFQDLGRIVPGLAQANFDPTRGGWGGALPIIRGLNANRLATAGPNVSAPTITTYYGNALLPMAMNFADIERIEVLRGPQGTLYGSGSMGGTIQIVPMAPELTESYVQVKGDLSSTAESDDPNYGVEGLVNWAVNDTLGVRLLAGSKERAGFIDEVRLVDLDGPNVPVAGSGWSSAGAPAGDTPFDPETFSRREDVNETETAYYRAKLLWQPTDGTSLALTYDRQDFESRRFPVDNPLFPGLDDYEGTSRIETPAERSLELLSLDLEADFGFATLSVNASDYDDDVDSVRDWTAIASTYVGPFYFAPYGIAPPPRLQATAFEFSENSGTTYEARLTSNGDRRLDWMAGVFYTEQDQVFDNEYWLPGATAYAEATGSFWPYRPPFFGDVAGVPDDVNWGFDRITAFEETSFFVDAAFALTDRWEVAGGLRYFDQEFEASANSFLFHCNQFCSEDGSDPRGSNFANNSSSFDDVVLRLSTNFRLNEDLRLYANYSEGFRRGGANAVATSGPFAETDNLVTFDPDTVESYEIGLRGQLGDLSFTTDIYYMDWEDPQIEGLTPSGYWYAVINASSARNYGFDLEVQGNVSDRLVASIGYAWVKAEIAEDFAVESAGGAIIGEKGNTLPGVPEHSLTLSLDWLQPNLFGGWDGTVNTNLSYRSEVWTDLETNSRAQELDGFALVNASWSMEKADTRLTFFVDNIFSERGVTAINTITAVGSGDPLLESYGEFVMRPRTMGLRVSYVF
jgi:outer membrane receptor protein involved in Fe transport